LDIIFKRFIFFQEEIKELMLRIERLRAEEDSFNKQIKDIDIKIENVADEYSSEREELLREKNELDNREREIEKKSVSFLTFQFNII